MFAGVMKNDMYPPLIIIKSHDILFLKKTQIKCAFERFAKKYNFMTIRIKLEVL